MLHAYHTIYPVAEEVRRWIEKRLVCFRGYFFLPAWVELAMGDIREGEIMMMNIKLILWGSMLPLCRADGTTRKEVEI